MELSRIRDDRNVETAAPAERRVEVPCQTMSLSRS